MHMKYNPLKAYNNLPDLPPGGDIETKAILKKVIEASRALSELKGAITNLPNPYLFIDTINLQEAQASSAIENIIARWRKRPLVTCINFILNKINFTSHKTKYFYKKSPVKTRLITCCGVG